ncbi:creatininase family protein [Bacteriovoracaceae bacterium]|nr:creatininase family protein [Bacteriovoracaceae bacterium]
MENKTNQSEFTFSGDGLKRNISESSILVVYVNPIEYHGEHLPLTTDLLISRGIKNLFPKELRENFIDWPPIHLGVGPTGGPGSCETSYLELKRVLLKLSKTIIRLKVKRVLVMTFHGAPLHILAIEEFVKVLRKNKVKAINPFILMLQKLTYFNPEEFNEIHKYVPMENEKERNKLIKNIKFDFHGGMIEAGLVQYFNPELIQKPLNEVPSIPELNLNNWIKVLENFIRPISYKLAEEIELINFVLQWGAIKPFPGYTGHPCLANNGLSEYFLNKVVLPSYLEEINKEFYGGGTKIIPVMNYMKYITFEGRLFY